jgi:hypothetical protein
LLPVIAPRSCDGVPSPQFTVTLRIGLAFVVAGVTANVNDAGTPALGGVVGTVMISVGAPATLTVTLPEAWPELAGVVGVPPPVAGGVVDEPPCAPTLAVTVD